MTTTLPSTRWRRLRFTPLRDMLRGRISGRLDLEQRLHDADLPEALRQTVARIIHRTRLWRLEKIAVADELIAHFEDGLADDRAAEDLIADFGDEKQAARLIRRAKIRNRPWPWQALRLVCRMSGGIAALYCLALLLLLTGRPDVSTDYLAQLNARALAVPEEDRAWPLYRQAMDAGFEDLDIRPLHWPHTPARHWNPLRPGDPDWAQARRWLHDHASLPPRLRAAAGRPGLGLPAFHRENLPTDTRLAYDRHGTSHWIDVPAESSVDQLARDSLMLVCLPLLPYWHDMNLVLLADMALAREEGDHDRMFENVDSLMGMARHAREIPSFLGQIVSMAILSRTLDHLAHLLHDDPARWAHDDLIRLAHSLARLDAWQTLDLTGETMSLQDVFQRIYSRHGLVTREGLVYLTRIGGMQPAKGRLHEASLVFWLPAASLTLAPRQAMEDQLQHLMAACRAEGDLPMWERANHQPFDLAIQSLAEDVVLNLRYAPILRTAPAMTSFFDQRDSLLTHRDALQTAIAMELYRRDHGAYPATLDALTPRYLPAVPTDRSSGGPLRLAFTPEGSFVLYGLGFDGLDDGGSPPAHEQTPSSRRPPRTGDWVLFPPHAAR